MKCYRDAVCELLKLPEERVDDIHKNLSEISVNVTRYVELFSEKFEASVSISKDLSNDLEYLYALSDILSFLLMYYPLYESFVTYARYPRRRMLPPRY